MIFIGIDPGVKTGLAIWDGTAKRFLCVETVSIVEAMAHIKQIDPHQIAGIFFEDAKQRQYLPQERNNSEYRGKLMGAGSVKRDCHIWQEFCAYWHIPCVKVPPRKGMTKWTQDAFENVTGYKGRTSNHARDAALLVFGRTTFKPS
jgi:hypothetical protein